MLHVLALLSTRIGSNYPCLELIYLVPKVFEPLKFDCIVLFVYLSKLNCLFFFLFFFIFFFFFCTVVCNFYFAGRLSQFIFISALVHFFKDVCSVLFRLCTHAYLLCLMGFFSKPLNS